MNEVMWAPQHMRKIFIGGIDYSTTDDTLKNHFSQFGEVVDAVVMKDNITMRSRGFGFVTYANPEHVDLAQKARPHKIDGRLVETKRAVPKNELHSAMGAQNHMEIAHNRIFIGGLPQDCSEEDLEVYFAHFGAVTCVNIMYDKNSGRHRGFGFVDFNDYDPVDKVLLTHNHVVKGRPIDVKKAISKAEIGMFRSFMSGGTMSPDAVGAPFGMGPFGPQVAGALSKNFSKKSDNNSSNGTSQFSGLKPSSSFNGEAETGSVSQVQANSATSSEIPLGSSQGGPPGMAPMFRPPMHPLARAFLPRFPYNSVPRYSIQLKSGWQYSVSKNAEVLKNTGDTENAAVSDSDSSNSDDDSVVLEELSGTSYHPSSTVSGTTIQEPDICPPEASILLLEPFYGGSHKFLLDILRSDESVLMPEKFALLTLPSKKWHWRARTSALYYSQVVPRNHKFEVLFASSTLNLCELLGLRPDLASLKKVLYFHENQLVYPVQKRKDRDFQYGYNQILSCLTADAIAFNSKYNLESFIREIPRHLKHQPKPRPNSNNLVEIIKEKSTVLHFPVKITHLTRAAKDALEPLHIVWPHRWEHDKDPDTFFQVLFSLVQEGLNFRLSILGESFSEVPHVFAEAQTKLANYINQWGFVEDRERYWEILHSGDVVISTAHHEFFGVAMLEAVGAGCYPLCPNRLVYPEIFPQDCLYNTTQQLEKLLTQWCKKPQLARSKRVSLDLNLYSWNNLRKQYAGLLNCDLTN